MKGIDLLPEEIAKPKRPGLFWVTALVIVSLSYSVYPFSTL